MVNCDYNQVIDNKNDNCFIYNPNNRWPCAFYKNGMSSSHEGGIGTEMKHPSFNDTDIILFTCPYCKELDAIVVKLSKNHKPQKCRNCNEDIDPDQIEKFKIIENQEHKQSTSIK